MPFITKRRNPNGGVVSEISRESSTNRPNKSGLKPMVLIIGINMGKVIIMMEICSIKVPRNNMTSCMNMMSMKGDRLRLDTY